MKKSQKKNKGITLVALVITIILLLILAGITISQLTGSGLFENAKLAEQKSKEAQEKEDGILEDYENQINGIFGTREEVNFSTTQLLSEPAIVPTTTSWVTRNIDFTLNYSIENYKMLLITFGLWNNTDSKIRHVDTRVISVDEIKLLNSDGNTEDSYFLLDCSIGALYSSASISFINDTTLRVIETSSANAGRTHFAITSVLGIK